MSRQKRLVSLILLLAATVVALAACAGEPTSTPTPMPTAQATGEPTSTHEPAPTPSTETSEDRTPEALIAPELRGIVGWINTEPFTLRSLHGKVILIDFWTYTCVNCIRTFPFLKEWYDKYADLGLVIVGVHSPEFEFEKIRENVEAAAVQYDLRYPIVQDNAFFTWHAYSNYAWPSKYLIDKDGVIRYIHVGEGAYATTEQKIRELLAEIGAPISQIPLGTTLQPDRDPLASTRGESGQTRELYASYIYQTETHYIGNTEYYSTPKNTPTLYQDPGDHRNNLLYLQGLWTNGSESLTHARGTKDLADYISIKFFGTTVNVVLNYKGDAPFRVVVTLAGNPIPEGFSGADVQHDDDGTSFLLVDKPRMYRVVEMPQFGGNELRLASDSDQFSVFAFTFGSYVEGP